jgi:ABC-2 type transport system ATP-binding protein
MTAIETRALTKSYGKHRGIVELSMAVEEGEVFGFIGPNGAGKSTTIRCLVGLIRPTRGSAEVFGMDVTRRGREIARLIGYLPAEGEYYDRMTVRELLSYSARFYGVSLDGRAQELIELFEVDLKRNISDLSQGNRKKVSILQCLLHRPRLLILDEPSSGLDPLMQARLYETLRRENEAGTTIFLSSHVLSEVQKICRRVAIIKEGTIIALEDIDTLRRRHLSRVRVELRDQASAEALRLPGLASFEVKTGGIEILYSGEINALLDALCRHPIDKLTIEEPSLEEVFMHYYQTPSAASSRQA